MGNSLFKMMEGFRLRIKHLTISFTGEKLTSPGVEPGTESVHGTSSTSELPSPSVSRSHEYTSLYVV